MNSAAAKLGHRTLLSSLRTYTCSSWCRLELKEPQWSESLPTRLQQMRNNAPCAALGLTPWMKSCGLNEGLRPLVQTRWAGRRVECTDGEDDEGTRATREPSDETAGTGTLEAARDMDQATSFFGDFNDTSAVD